MILYVVRHGEATWNVLNKICGGQSDVPLTEKGRQAHTHWKEQCAQAEQVMLQGFSDAEREQFADFLTRAYQNFKESAKEGQP